MAQQQNTRKQSRKNVAAQQVPQTPAVAPEQPVVPQQPASVAPEQVVVEQPVVSEQVPEVASEQPVVPEQPATPEVAAEQPAAPVQQLRRSTDVVVQLPQQLRRSSDITTQQSSSAPITVQQPVASQQKRTRADVALRPMQNGVRRPAPESLCGQAWQVFDELSQLPDKPVAISDALVLGNARKLHPGNIRAEYAAWRKFNGIKGRVAPQQTAVVAPQQQPAVAQPFVPQLPEFMITDESGVQHLL